MTAATICRCGTLTTPGDQHSCPASQQARARDQARRNQRPLTQTRQTSAWRRKAAAVRRRDRHTCQHCGQPGRIVDHINPAAGDDEWNLQVLCARCSGKKDGGRRYA